MSDSEYSQAEASAGSGSPSVCAHTEGSTASGPPLTIDARTEASEASGSPSPIAAQESHYLPLDDSDAGEASAAEDENSEGEVHREDIPDLEPVFGRATTRVEGKPTWSSAAQFGLVDGQRDALMQEVKSRAQLVQVDFILGILPSVAGEEVRDVLDKLRGAALIRRDGTWAKLFKKPRADDKNLTEPRIYEPLVPLVRKIFALSAAPATGTPIDYQHRPDSIPSSVHRRTDSRPDAFVMFGGASEHWINLACVAEFKKRDHAGDVRDVSYPNDKTLL